ncbi:hypothetical protein [Phytohabitans kaempferiae]|uniref:PknH-like extracellular domain-containing protein n=1 Tax=Phytohabitans kaempferiae TaxID=1620943 RepID=A0ABV6MCW6_9ACTN
MRGARLLALVVVVVLVSPAVACSTDNAAGPATSAVPSTPAPTTSAAATASPSATAQRVIDSSALLQPADLGDSPLEPLPEGQSAHLRPARPCEARYPSDATRTAAVAMRAQVSPGAGQTPSIVIQYVGLHPGHAADAFADIAAAVERCPGGLQRGQREWRTVGTGVAGDESMLLRISERFDYGDANVVTTVPVAVARVGDHITVVANLGWESASGDEQYVRELVATAVDRLRANA